MSTTDGGRENSRLEQDNDMFCVGCGVNLGYYASQIHGFERCPDCYLERERKRVLAVFGTTETSEALSPIGIQATIDPDAGLVPDYTEKRTEER